MRELKFRAWDKEWEMFLYSDQVLCIGDFFNSIDEDEGRHDDVQRFTGITDKDGKEIYEGDIISYWDGPRFVSAVYFDEEYLQYGVKVKTSWGCPLYRCYECEVIGNIYEDPELLGVKE